MQSDEIKLPYTQGFAVNSVLVGGEPHVAVGKTFGILVIIRHVEAAGGGRVVTDTDRLLGPNPFDFDPDRIYTQRIIVPFFKEAVDVDCVFIGPETLEEDVKVWAKSLGYEEIKVVLEGDVQLLD